MNSLIQTTKTSLQGEINKLKLISNTSTVKSATIVTDNNDSDNNNENIVNNSDNDNNDNNDDNNDDENATNNVSSNTIKLSKEELKLEVENHINGSITESSDNIKLHLEEA